MNVLNTAQQRYDWAMWFALLALALTSTFRADQPSNLQAQDLTVPRQHLPQGCELAADNSKPLWGSLPVPTNPWVGDDAPLAGRVRELVEGRTPLADGPPPTNAELSRLRLQLAQGVEEAYAAFYNTPKSNLVGVFAIKLASNAAPTEFDEPRSTVLKNQ